MLKKRKTRPEASCNKIIYMPSRQDDLKVCVRETVYKSLASSSFSLTSGACPFSQCFYWFPQGSGRRRSCTFCLQFLALRSGSSGRTSWQHRSQRSRSRGWLGWSESSSPGCQGLRWGSASHYQEGCGPEWGVQWILCRSACKRQHMELTFNKTIGRHS